MDGTKTATVLDVRGKVCPYPVIETREALKALAAGDTLEVLSDFEPAALGTIPHFCRQKGYPYDVREEGSHLWRVVIQKTD